MKRIFLIIVIGFFILIGSGEAHTYRGQPLGDIARKTAVSQNDDYLILQHGVAIIDDVNLKDQVNPISFIVRGGRYFTDNFGFETRAGFGIIDDAAKAENSLFGEVDVRLKWLFGVHGRFVVYPVDNLQIYGLIGLAGALFSGDNSAIGNLTMSSFYQGISYGAGMVIYPAADWGLVGEYIVYMNEKDHEWVEFGFGLKRSF